MTTQGQKPYRVYRGGRVKGKVPLERRLREEERQRLAAQAPGGTPPTEPTSPVRRRPRRRWSWGRRIGVGVAVLVLLLVIWAVAGYLSVRSGVGGAHKRLPQAAGAALTKQDGLLLSTSTNILLLGTDHSSLAARATDRHSDSIMLLRTDPDHHRLFYLSIPRDLRVPVPGHGDDKINVAMQIGGPALAIRTVENFTGLPVNHVVVVDFGDFENLINAVGGIDVDIPENIVSPFECPYATQAQCQRWRGWHFKKGKQHLDGRRALIYSRVRKNLLNPADTDISRAARQQQVLQALLNKLGSLGMFFKLPFTGSDVLKPITTDLSTNQFLQLGWIKFRAGTVIHCRLGGEDFGSGYIVSSEDNRQVIQEVLGNSAPQPPRPGSGPFGAGCLVGSQDFK